MELRLEQGLTAIVEPEEDRDEIPQRLDMDASESLDEVHIAMQRW